MSNKFTHRRQTVRRPPICLSKPPPKPYQHPPYPPAGDAGELSAAAAWTFHATLPAVPHPPFDPIYRRNLIFHLYPNKRNTAWIENLNQLQKRWPLFNGRRVIACVTGPGLVPIKHVRQHVAGDAEIMDLPNDPRLRETATFLWLLRAIRSLHRDEATFYAHTKGASPHNASISQKALAIQLWRDRMYHELLDRWPDVGRALESAAVCGTFKIDYSNFPEHVMRSPTGLEWGNWHYAGTFHWFRHDCIFRNPHWSAIADDPYAVEMWLGALIDTRLAASVYQPWPALQHPNPDLYDPASHAPQNF